MRLNSKVILSLASVMMMSECAWAMDKETDTASAGSVRSKSPEGPAAAGAGATPVVTQAHYAMPAVSPIERTVSHVSSDSATASKASTQKARAVTSLPPLDISGTKKRCDEIMVTFRERHNAAYALSCLESLNKKVNDPIYAPAKEDEGKALSELKHDILLKITEVNSFAKGHSEGFSEGHASGVNKGVQDCARNMLQKNMSWRLIMQVTALSYEELKSLSATLPNNGKLAVMEEEDSGYES